MEHAGRSRSAACIGRLRTTAVLVSKRSSFAAAVDLKLPDSLKMLSAAGFSAGFLVAGMRSALPWSSCMRSAVYFTWWTIGIA